MLIKFIRNPFIRYLTEFSLGGAFVSILLGIIFHEPSYNFVLGIVAGLLFGLVFGYLDYRLRFGYPKKDN